jgi:hypothetical protein
LALLRRYCNAAERDFQRAWKNVEVFHNSRIANTLLCERVKDLYFLNRKRGFYDNTQPLFADPPTTEDKARWEREKQKRQQQPLR